MEVWHEPAGTHTLAGRHLPAAGVLAADKRISALARDLKAAGAEGTLQQLRASVFLAVLAGQPPTSLLPPTCGASGGGAAGGPSAAPASAEDASSATPSGGGTWPKNGTWPQGETGPGLSGSVNR